MSPVLPPLLPVSSIYTSCYCEENVYLLCKSFLEDGDLTKDWDVYVAFISNTTKTVAIWYQKAARSPEDAVVWDYHVVLVLRRRESQDPTVITEAASAQEPKAWVYDFDTILDVPCPWQGYVDLAIPDDILPAYQSQFRVIDGRSFLDNFASDRSHMLREGFSEPEYMSPPPTYPAICGALAKRGGVVNNLMDRYVSMSMAEGSSGEYGRVLSRHEANEFFDR